MICRNHFFSLKNAPKSLMPQNIFLILSLSPKLSNKKINKKKSCQNALFLTGPTFGGLSTREEMCLGFILYYPR